MIETATVPATGAWAELRNLTIAELWSRAESAVENERLGQRLVYAQRWH